MKIVPKSRHSGALKQTQFNMKFTRALSPTTCIACCIPAINHAPFPFTENKRYPTKPGEFDDVVNRNRDSVYQTDAVLALSCFAHKRRRHSGAPRRKQ